MILACYPAGFKIKSKADVVKAVSYMTKGRNIGSSSIQNRPFASISARMGVIKFF